MNIWFETFRNQLQAMKFPCSFSSQLFDTIIWTKRYLFDYQCVFKLHVKQNTTDRQTAKESLRMPMEGILLWFYVLKIHLVSLYTNCQTQNNTFAYVLSVLSALIPYQHDILRKMQWFFLFRINIFCWFAFICCLSFLSLMRYH